MTLRHVMMAAAIGASAIVGAAANAQTTHDYEFTTGLDDAVPGGTALAYSSRTGTDGSVAGGVYAFDRGQGLMLGSQLPGATYTIDISAAFDNVDGYRKLVSFNNINNDSGLYIYSGGLRLFNVASGPEGVVTAGTSFDARLSRDGATGIVTGYLNGVFQFDYTDTSGFFSANTSLYFLRDDTSQNGEDSAGTADFIRISTSAAGAPPVATPPSVPEPATWAMTILGFGMAGMALRRRSSGTPVRVRA